MEIFTPCSAHGMGSFFPNSTSGGCTESLCPDFSICTHSRFSTGTSSPRIYFCPAEASSWEIWGWRGRWGRRRSSRLRLWAHRTICRQSCATGRCVATRFLRLGLLPAFSVLVYCPLSPSWFTARFLRLGLLPAFSVLVYCPLSLSWFTAHFLCLGLPPTLSWSATRFLCLGLLLHLSPRTTADPPHQH
eukprot:scaffold14331_cov79-Isochrysis_galbana.AAC.1